MPREFDPPPASDTPRGDVSGILVSVLALDGREIGHAEDRVDDTPNIDSLASGWRALASGTAPDDAALARLERDARQRQDARSVIEAASLRALALADATDVDEALVHARRAARMARTERLPEAEGLAGLALARLRRLTGRPYLATRIGSALRGMVPLAWYPWVDWEVAMAGGSESEDKAGPAAQLIAAIDDARTGRRDHFDRTLTALHDRLGGLAFAARDLAWVRTVLDPSWTLHDAPASLRSWCDGTSGYAPAPNGLAGLSGVDLTHGTSSGVGLVVAQRQRRGRRVLRAAEGLARHATDDRWLGDGTVGRTDAIVSALALRGPDGAPDAEIFADAYGFAFSAPVHRGAFDVALHRARKYVEPFGQIERTEGRIALDVKQAFVVADPRSIPGTDDRLLAHLAASGEVSARHLAAGLGVPLRTVQEALRGLVDDGACRRGRAGRQILYAIEDTTFQEPTQAPELQPTP